MKRTIKALGLFLSANLFLAGCSSDKESVMKNSATEGVVYDHSTSEPVQSSPLSVFMSKELCSPSWDRQGNQHYTFFYIDEERMREGDIEYEREYYKDTCIVINSMEEFRLAYHGNETLPEVDFTNNTLLICKTYVPDTYKLGDVALRDKRTQYELQYRLLRYLNGTSLCWERFIYYWRLCPKLQSKPIVMKREIIDIDD